MLGERVTHAHTSTTGSVIRSAIKHTTTSVYCRLYIIIR